MSTDLKCKRPGCQKKYLEAENTAESCKYHSGKPIFHDCKKGWTCCNVIVWDWDEFQKIEGCAIGAHTDKKEDVDFFKSQTVNNAQKGIENRPEQVPQSIDAFNKAEEDKKRANEVTVDESQMTQFITKTGLWKCTNKGCNKEFDSKDNNETACQYHPGAPIFHDTVKSWSCCKVEAWEWETFMKLATCAVASHAPKMVKKA